MKLTSIISSIVLALISGAFQLTIALYPHQLQPYAWLVKYLWTLSVVLGALWLLLKLMEKNEAPSPVQAATVPSINISPVFNQVASPVITQTAAAPQQIRIEKEKAKPRPNLLYVDTIEMRIREESCTLIDSRPTGIPGNHALVAVIANRPAAGSTGVAKLYAARAHIVYKNKEHEVHSGYGAWIGQFSNRVNFAPGESQKLVLVYEYVPMRGLVFAVTNPRQNEPPVSPFPPRRRVPKRPRQNDTAVLQDREVDIEITLYDDNGLVLAMFNLRYERAEDGTYKITRV